MRIEFTGWHFFFLDMVTLVVGAPTCLPVTSKLTSSTATQRAGMKKSKRFLLLIKTYVNGDGYIIFWQNENCMNESPLFLHLVLNKLR